MSTPTWSPWWRLVANITTMGIAVAILAYFVIEWRRGRKLRWWDLMLLFHLSIASIYIPFGPLAWLSDERSARKRHRDSTA